jgi:membrane-bound lytic murein transglycosylase B
MAREIPVAEHLEKQLAAGRKVIANDSQSRALFAQLKSECPDVDEDAIVRSFATPGFGTKNVEAAVIATVRQKQFNASNPRTPFADIFNHLLPPKLIAEVRDDPEYRAQFADLLSEIETEKEPDGGISTTQMRKEISESLK